MKTLLNYLLNKQWILSIVMCFLSERKKEKIYIARFRTELAFWGYDISNMTDKEIKNRVNRMSITIERCGITVDQFNSLFLIGKLEK